jgi:pilus assembly protein CpaB
MRGLIMLIVALVLAVAAVLVARNYLQQQSRPVVTQQPTLQTTTVVVARQRLDFADKLGPEKLQEIQWPANAVPPGTFKTVGELIKPGEDRVALRSIEVGEPIFAAKVSGSGQRASLSSIIDKDMRAMTIRVNDIVGVAGFVLPGDRVDLLLTREDPSRAERGREGTITDVLLQNIRVLGIDQSASDRQEKPVVVKAVTLELTPQQAQKITLASQVGSITLVLRNEANSDAAKVKTVSIEDLRVGEVVRPLPPEPKVIVKEVVKEVERPAPPPAADPTVSVRVVRGLKAGTDERVYREGAASAPPAPLAPKGKAG